MSDERPEGLSAFVESYERLVKWINSYPGSPHDLHDVYDAHVQFAEAIRQLREQSTALARLLRGDYTPEEIATVQIRQLLERHLSERVRADDAEAEVTRLREERDRLLELPREWRVYAGGCDLLTEDAFRQCADELESALSSPSASEKSPNE